MFLIFTRSIYAGTVNPFMTDYAPCFGVAINNQNPNSDLEIYDCATNSQESGLAHPELHCTQLSNECGASPITVADGCYLFTKQGIGYAYWFSSSVWAIIFKINSQSFTGFATNNEQYVINNGVDKTRFIEGCAINLFCAQQLMRRDFSDYDDWTQALAIDANITWGTNFRSR